MVKHDPTFIENFIIEKKDICKMSNLNGKQQKNESKHSVKWNY